MGIGSHVGKQRTLATAGLALALLLLVALGAHSSCDAVAHAEAARRVSSTHETIEALQSITAGIASAESALRGFALTRDEDLLRELAPGILDAREAVAESLRLTAAAADSDAHQRVRAVQPKVEQRVALLEERLQLIQERGDTAVSREAVRLTDEIRRDVADVLSRERELLKLRHDETTLQTSRALLMRPLGTVAAIALVLVAFAVLSREMARRRQTELRANERLAEMKLLSEMGELLQACRTSDEAYQVINVLVPRFFPKLAGAVSMFRSSRDILEAKAAWGTTPVLVGSSLAPDDCWALRRGQTHACDGGIRCSHGAGHEASTLCVPMAAHGELIGCLQLAQDGGVDADARRVASVLAEHMAMALANLQLRETLKLQSIRDPPTGLFNRRYTEETLVRELHRAQRAQEPLSVLFLDVDHFKKFNDSFGHDAGDHVLKELAQVLKTSTRGSDVAARMGGEELVVVLPSASSDGAAKRAEQIRASIEALSLRHRGQGLGKLTVSIGVATTTSPDMPADELLRAADAALYRAKHEGRNRVVLA